MKSIGQIIKERSHAVNNDSRRNNVNNDNNVDKKRFGKYELDKSKFKPNTPETLLAEEISVSFNDIKNYASFLNVVNKIGTAAAERLFRATLSDIKDKEKTKFPVRNKAKYFMYKYRFKKY